MALAALVVIVLVDRSFLMYHGAIGVEVGLGLMTLANVLAPRPPVQIARAGMWLGFFMVAVAGVFQIQRVMGMGAGVMTVCLVESWLHYGRQGHGNVREDGISPHGE